MTIRLIILLFSGSLFMAQTNTGTYVLSLEAKDPASGKIIKPFPDDSIFVSGNIGIEKIKRIDDLVIDKMSSRTINTSGYNIINFHTRMFRYTTSLDTIINKEIIDQPLTNKKIGYDLSTQYYNNEKYSLTKDLVNGVPVRILTFTSSNPVYKGTTFTFYLLPPDPERTMLIPNIEKRFNGRVLQLKSSNSSGELTMKVTWLKGLNANWKKIFTHFN